MWQPFLRAKPALECGSSSYRLPPLLCAAITQREGKAVAAATALQGASRRLRLRLVRIGHKGPPHVVIMLTKNIKWGGIALQKRSLPVPQSGGPQGPPHFSVISEFDVAAFPAGEARLGVR